MIYLKQLRRLGRGYSLWGIFDTIKRIRLSKRQQFVVVVLLLTIGLVTTQLIPIEQRLQAVGIFALSSFLLSLFSLREDLKGIEYLVLPILPVMFTVAVCFFYFLLPERWLTRVPTAILYGFLMYAILLTENIYNVARIRSIQLLRAAHSVGFLVTIITAFLLFDTALSFHLTSYYNAILVFAISFPLTVQLLWSMVLESRISKSIITGSLVCSLTLAQSAYFLSFWPVNITIFSIFLTTLFYSISGLIREKLIDRLFPNTIREFLGVALVTFLLLAFITRWG